MKKMYLIICITCITIFYSYGQNNRISDGNHYKSLWHDTISFGVKVGTNYSNVYDTEGELFKTNPKFGFATGVFLAVPLVEFLGMQFEVLFSQKGYRATGVLLGSTYEFSRSSNFIDVPLLIAIKPLKRLTILAGPQYSFLVSQSNEFEIGQTTIAQKEEFDTENLRKNTLCFTGGIDLNLNPVVIGVRAGWDFFKNNGDSLTTTPRYKNTWYQLTLGYLF